MGGDCPPGCQSDLQHRETTQYLNTAIEDAGGGREERVEAGGEEGTCATFVQYQQINWTFFAGRNVH